jgi:antitoxin (DNA-binding transcriptional repressor) of toxin-antitoxin stability system
MRSVAIEQLKDRLGEYVRLAAAGEVVLVTDRDRVVAEFGPPRAARPRTPEEEDAIIQDWVRRGIAPAPTQPPGVHWQRHGLVPHEELMADLERDREDRI